MKNNSSNPDCPNCGGATIKDGDLRTGGQRYECRECGKKTSRPILTTKAALSFGENLRLLRKQKGFTLERASSSIGKRRAWLSRIENSHRSISIDDLFLLADVYGTRPSKIMNEYEQSYQKRTAKKRRTHI